MTKILVGSGGGAMGVQQLGFLSAIEDYHKKPTHDIFNLFVGTSTFGIIAAALASGKYTAKELLYNFYIPKMKKLFKKNFPILNLTWTSLYSRNTLDNEINKIFGDMKLGEVKKDLIVTGTLLEDGLTHFFKNYKSKYQDIRLADAVKVTYSAPVYFKSISFKDTPLKGTWLDGGTGIDNFPVSYAIYESLFKRRHDRGQEIKILGVGTGNEYTPPQANFLTPSSVKGAMEAFTLGRYQSEYRQDLQGRLASSEYENFSYYFLDKPIKKKYNRLDNTNVDELKYIANEAYNYAKKNIDEIIKFING